MYSQDENSTPGFNYDFRIYNAYSFPTPHIHKSAELILSISGEAEVGLGNKTFTLSEGEAALALHFKPHSFESGISKTRRQKKRQSDLPTDRRRDFLFSECL